MGRTSGVGSAAKRTYRPEIPEEGPHWPLERFKLGSHAVGRQTTGGGAHTSPFLVVNYVVGRSLVVRVKFNGMEIACLIDMGQQVRPVYEAHTQLPCERIVPLG